MAEISGDTYRAFLDYFSENYPSLRSMFPEVIEWSFATIPYGTRKPSDMAQEDFDKFRVIEQEWLIKNGTLYQPEGEVLFIRPINGLEKIVIKNVTGVDFVSENITAIKVLHPFNETAIFNVVGDLDTVKAKLGL